MTHSGLIPKRFVHPSFHRSKSCITGTPVGLNFTGCPHKETYFFFFFEIQEKSWEVVWGGQEFGRWKDFPPLKILGNRVEKAIIFLCFLLKNVSGSLWTPRIEGIPWYFKYGSIKTQACEPPRPRCVRSFSTDIQHIWVHFHKLGVLWNTVNC